MEKSIAVYSISSCWPPGWNHSEQILISHVSTYTVFLKIKQLKIETEHVSYIFSIHEKRFLTAKQVLTLDRHLLFITGVHNYLLSFWPHICEIDAVILYFKALFCQKWKL